jgi:hypothetical protein
MNGEWLKYDRALAAGRFIYETFVPEPAKPDARILGQIVFTIIDAMQEAERKQASAVKSLVRLQMDDGGNPEEQWPRWFLFFCPICSGVRRLTADRKSLGCQCPKCGVKMQAPGVTARN